MSDNEPYLAEIGANSREPADEVNMDVSGTVGPDHMGQQTVNVDGHRNDRPGVQYRLPENGDPTYTDMRGDEHVHREIQKMDTGEELPVLLNSSMRADPIEGTQGSYTQIIEGECNRCGYDRLIETVVTLAGERQFQCNACNAKQRPRSDRGYVMPTLPEERAERTREANEILLEVNTQDLVKVNDHDVRLVGDRNTTYVPIDTMEAYFWALIDNEDIDIVESIESNRKQLERIGILIDLLPDFLTLATVDEEEEEDNDEE